MVADLESAGATIAGRVVADLSSLKEQGLIEPESGPDSKYYEIHYELVMEVDGRNLKISLLYPPGQECQGRTQISIAAAFRPGTE
jgi:predicted transcriptional regulator